MYRFYEVSRSGYYEWTNRTDQTERDQDLCEKIMECQKANKNRYGYRRVAQWLFKKHGIKANHKAVLRIMNQYSMLSKIRRKRNYNK